MRINEHISLKTTTLSLVPYTEKHVPQYHKWMSDPDIQAATASEPLSLEEEYEMCERWRGEGDKLTFIIEKGERGREGFADGVGQAEGIGDVNLFISVQNEGDDTECDGDYDDTGNGEPDRNSKVVGELELMIARKEHQRKGYGRVAILVFLLYIISHEQEIMEEFFGNTGMHDTKTTWHENVFDYFSVKIGSLNERSIKLFEGLGFRKVREEANYFGEFELRLARGEVTGDGIKGMMERYGVERYEEGRFIGMA